MIVEIPHIVRLEEECHNFLCEAKNFVRDFLKAFNILYGATFAEASNYFRPATPKKRETVARLVRRNDVRAERSETRRDRNKPIQYVVTASPELKRKFAELQVRRS
jgi:hypothetical protein